MRIALLAALMTGAALSAACGDEAPRPAPVAATRSASAARPAPPPARASGAPAVAALVGAAARLRALAPRRPIAVRSLGPREMAALVARLARQDDDPAAAAGWDAALHVLGVLAAREHLHDLVTANLEQSVAGLYDPASRRLYVLAGASGRPPSVVVHEATHALQDQYFDLRRAVFGEVGGDADATLAAHAAVEGDATDVQQRYLQGAGAAAVLGEGLAALGQLRGMQAPLPAFLQREQLFPYLDGQAFVQALRARGGERLVDRALRRPPRTTAAVLDPARYLAGDPPGARITLPPARGRLLLDTTFGAADLVALTGERSLARSWRGGRIAVERTAGRDHVTLVLAVRDGAAVARALRGSLPPSARVRLGGAAVRVSL